MTVSTLTNRVVYSGNGSATSFAVPFKVLDVSHLVVQRQVAATGAVEHTYIGTEFSYSGIGADSGTLTLTGTALSSTYKLTIERIVPYTQDLDLVNSGGFYPETVENELDLIVMAIQQVAARPDLLVPGTLAQDALNATQAAFNAVTSANSASTSANAAGVSAASANAAAAAAQALANGYLFDTAAEGVSQGILSLTITGAGSGGANGNFPLAFSGGGGSLAAGNFTVAGEVVTDVSLTKAGKNYTSNPTVSTAASSGLTSATVTAAKGNYAVPDGLYYLVKGSGNIAASLYKNVGGVATAQGIDYPSLAAIIGIPDIVKGQTYTGLRSVAPAVGDLRQNPNTFMIDMTSPVPPGGVLQYIDLSIVDDGTGGPTTGIYKFAVVSLLANGNIDTVDASFDSGDLANGLNRVAGWTYTAPTDGKTYYLGGRQCYSNTCGMTFRPADTGFFRYIEFKDITHPPVSGDATTLSAGGNFRVVMKATWNTPTKGNSQEQIDDLAALVTPAPRGQALRSAMVRTIASGAPIILVDNSIGEPQYFTTADSKHWFNKLQAEMCDVSPGDAISSSQFDPTVRTHYNWDYTGTAPTIINGGPMGIVALSVPSGTVITFTGDYDQIGLAWDQQAGGGSIVVKRGATTLQTIPTAGTLKDQIMLPFATGGSGSTAYSITATGGPIILTMWHRLKNAPAGVVAPRFQRFCLSGANTARFAGTAALASQTKLATQGLVATGAKPLVIIGLLENDAVSNVGASLPVATTQANLITIYNAYLAAGCSVLARGGLRPNPALFPTIVSGTHIEDYLAAQVAACVACGVPLWDLAGFDMAGNGELNDGLHPNNGGYTRFLSRFDTTVTTPGFRFGGA